MKPYIYYVCETSYREFWLCKVPPEKRYPARGVVYVFRVGAGNNSLTVEEAREMAALLNGVKR